MNVVEQTTFARETVEAALDALGVGWRPRDEGWVIPGDARIPREIRLDLRADTLTAEAVLTSWDDLGDTERKALALLLERAGEGFSFLRGEVRATEAVLDAEMLEGEIERRLGACVRELGTAIRLLSREAGALLSPGVARDFLEFQHNGDAVGKGDGPHP